MRSMASARSEENGFTDNYTHITAIPEPYMYHLETGKQDMTDMYVHMYVCVPVCTV